jgi:hypothetical protein
MQNESLTRKLYVAPTLPTHVQPFNHAIMMNGTNYISTVVQAFGADEGMYILNVVCTDQQLFDSTHYINSSKFLGSLSTVSTCT